MDDEKLIQAMSKRQKENLLDAYVRYKKTAIKHEDCKKQLGIGLKTGAALCRKGLVWWSAYQLSYWTMWEITEKGIHIAELILKEDQWAKYMKRFHDGI